jgi:uncharacterized membrane protein YgdD (TMEM256/DUF423 family)
MERVLYLLGAAAGLIGVALGAFGAHALRARLSPEMLVIFETSVRYQMYHAFALFATAWGWARWRHPAFRVAGVMFAAGMALFSGSLYALAMSGVRSLGIITPFGGAALLAGWCGLAWGAYRGSRDV